MAISRKLLSYDGVTSEVMYGSDDYRYRGAVIASMRVAGGALCLSLALEKNESKVPCELVSADPRLPISVALATDKGLGRGEALVEVLAEKLELVKLKR